MTAPIRHIKIDAQAYDFQCDLERLVIEPAPRLLRLWPLLGLGLFACLITLAALLRVDVVVTATGRLAVDVPPVILQPLNRAVLRDLLVRPGDVVAPGQVVARLDPTMPDADRAALDVQQQSLRAEIARLEAELSGQTTAPGGQDATLQAHVREQRDLLAAAQRGALQAAADGIEQAMRLETDAGANLLARLAIARDIEAMRDALVARHSGSRLSSLEAQLARLDAEAALTQHDARMRDLAQRLAATRSDLSIYDIDRTRQITEALADLRPRLAEVQEALSKADRLAALAELRAPRAGVVLTVAAGGPGSVIAEGEPVVILVPSDAPLIAEIAIRSSEVGAIALGDLVSVKVDAFAWRRHGMLTGRLIDVGHASFTPDGGTEALHPARVSLSGSALRDLPEGTALLPGMTVSAEIKTGTRSVLEYFLDPLMRGMNESLREP